MSLVSPASVRLEWYATDDAFACADLNTKIWEDIKAGANKLFLSIEETVWESREKVVTELLHQLKQAMESGVSMSVNAMQGEQPNSEVSSPSDSEELESTEYNVSESSFKCNIRWALTYLKFKARGSLHKQCIAQLKALQVHLRTSVIIYTLPQSHFK